MAPAKGSKKSDEVQAKLQRKHILEQQKRLKPGECLKYMKVFLGSNIFAEINEIGKKCLLHNKLVESNVRYDFTTLPSHENLIFWERSDQQTLVNDENNLALTEKFTKEANVIIIINALNFTSAPQSLNGQIKELRSSWPIMPLITVAVYGMDSLPSKPSAIDLETKLAEFQILQNLNIRILHKYSDFLDMVVNFTKAVSEIPFKKQEAAKFKVSGSCGFLKNDNKDCVRVEDNNAGMSRLWQQHITRLPLVTLDVAETITSEFSCPKKLIDFMEEKSEAEFINHVSNLKIKRGLVGNLDNARRLGPELAKKLLTLFGSLNPDEYL